MWDSTISGKAQSFWDCHARIGQARNDKKEGNFRKTKPLRFEQRDKTK